MKTFLFALLATAGTLNAQSSFTVVAIEPTIRFTNNRADTLPDSYVFDIQIVLDIPDTTTVRQITGTIYKSRQAGGDSTVSTSIVPMRKLRSSWMNIASSPDFFMESNKLYWTVPSQAILPQYYIRIEALNASSQLLKSEIISLSSNP